MLKKRMKVRLGRSEAEETRRPGTRPSLVAAPHKRYFCSRLRPRARQLSLGWFLLPGSGRSMDHLGGSVKGRQPL